MKVQDNLTELYYGEN